MTAVLRYFHGAAGDYLRRAARVRELALAPRSGDPIARLGRQLMQRELRFLDLVLRFVFERAGNPYFHMFRLAGCRYEDLVEIVLAEGLEAALQMLHRNGVFLTGEERSCSKPIVRQGREIASSPNSFGHWRAEGSLQAMRNGYFEGYELLRRREFGLAGRAHIQVRPVWPAQAAIHDCLRAARRGGIVDRWFAPGGFSGQDGRQWLGAGFLAAVARVHGLAVPFPSPFAGNDYGAVSRFIAERKRHGTASFVGSVTSHASRVAGAALANGHDIAGAIFFAGGEPVTAAKRALVRQAGAAIFPIYSIPEIGPIGFACREMEDGATVHLFEDSVAAISHRRSLLFTTLLPMAPQILINFETTDSATLERASCHCCFRRAGFTRRLRSLTTFGQLTAFGAAVPAAALTRLVEVALPRRFGGAAGDYQLVEGEGGAQTEVTLRISPRAGVESLEAVKQFFWNELPASRTWSQAGAFHVFIADPVRSSSGLVPSLELLARG